MFWKNKVFFTSTLKFVFLFNTFYFGIIIHLQEVAKIIQACTLHPMVTSYKATVWIKTRRSTLVQCICASVFLSFYHVQISVTSTILKIQNSSITTKICLVLSIYSHASPFHPRFLNPGNHFVLHLYNFVLSRMLHKWNHILWCIQVVVFINSSFVLLLSSNDMAIHNLFRLCV